MDRAYSGVELGRELRIELTRALDTKAQKNQEKACSKELKVTICIL